MTVSRARSSKAGEFRKYNIPPATANSTTTRMAAIARKTRLLKNLNVAPPLDGLQPVFHFLIHLFGCDAVLELGRQFRGLQGLIERRRCDVSPARFRRKNRFVIVTYFLFCRVDELTEALLKVIPPFDFAGHCVSYCLTPDSGQVADFPESL